MKNIDGKRSLPVAFVDEQDCDTSSHRNVVDIGSMRTWPS